MDLGVFLFLEALAILPLIFAVRQKNYLSLLLIGFGIMGSASVLLFDWDEFDGVSYQTTHLDYLINGTTGDLDVSGLSVETVQVLQLNCYQGLQGMICPYDFHNFKLQELVGHFIGVPDPDDFEFRTSTRGGDDSCLALSIFELRGDTLFFDFQFVRAYDFGFLNFVGPGNVRIASFSYSGYQSTAFGTVPLTEGEITAIQITFQDTRTFDNCDVLLDVHFPYDEYRASLDPTYDLADLERMTDYSFLTNIIFVMHLLLLIIYFVVLWDAISVLGRPRSLFK